MFALCVPIKIIVMKYLFFIFLWLVCFPCCAVEPSSAPREIRVMSFNIWVGGGKSIPATAQVMKESGVDIIGVQESTRKEMNTSVYIADSLGWYSYAQDADRAVISKYAIVDTSANGKGVKIKVDEKQFVWIFNVHLMYCPYEPYQLNGIEYCGAPLLQTAEEAVASAWKSRRKEVEAVIADINEVKKEGYPVFLTGDFNEPSYLDWTTRAAKAGICKMAVVWPATKAFHEQVGMNDSYRVVYPNEVKKPGHTWTSIPPKEGVAEVMDRIDFVLYWGKMKVKSSIIIGEKSSFSDIGFDHYPSDHRAVLSTFQLK